MESEDDLVGWDDADDIDHKSERGKKEKRAKQKHKTSFVTGGV